jgi:hypothetical protein
MHRLKRKHVSFAFARHLLNFIFNLECAALVKDGKVYGVGTEDMDVCTIGIRLRLFLHRISRR